MEYHLKRSLMFLLSYWTFCSSLTIDDTFRAKAYNYRQRFLVLHYTAVNFNTSLDILTGKRVSSHYLVPTGPTNGKRVIYRLVPENLRAWTQGISSWEGRNNINDQSVSIEIVNYGYKDIGKTRRYFSYPDFQIESVINLCQDIVKRYGIQQYNVIGHSDCSPGRKVDPGPLFPWKLLHKNGCGAWPNEEDVTFFMKSLSASDMDVGNFLDDLRRYGYKRTDPKNIRDVRNVVQSFQMHFRSRLFDGVIDRETYAILKALLKKYK